MFPPFARTGIAAGSSIPIDLMKSLISKLNLVDLTNAYGMSASTPVHLSVLVLNFVTAETRWGR